MRVLGIDGWKDGWVAILLESGRFAGAYIDPSLQDLIAAVSDVETIAVDMPIGLVESGWRDCDLAARGYLTSRASSVFPIPPRAAVEASSYDEGKALCQEINGKMFSKQAHALFPKILDANVCAEQDKRVYEVHPEVSFQVLAGAPLKGSKKSWAGVTQRTNLLGSGGVIVPPCSEVLARVPADDVLDAAVAAWTANRIATGEARTFPTEPTQHRGESRPIAIWA